jgi:hypothetical protein
MTSVPATAPHSWRPESWRRVQDSNHSGTMDDVSIPLRFFSTSDDASAAEALGRDPESVMETAARDRFLPSSAMTEWETLLTGRGPEGHAHAPRPRVVADDWPRSSSKIFLASPELRVALAAADHGSLTETADQWICQYGVHYGSFDPAEVRKILYEMSGLVRSANAERAGVYFWMR